MNVKNYLINQEFLIHLNEMNQIKQLKPILRITYSENLLNINDASINIPILITKNELNQSKQNRNQQQQQNLIQPNIVNDQSNNEKIQFLPKHSAKHQYDQHQSQPSANRQKKQIILPQKSKYKKRTRDKSFLLQRT